MKDPRSVIQSQVDYKSSKKIILKSMAEEDYRRPMIFQIRLEALPIVEKLLREVKTFRFHENAKLGKMYSHQRGVPSSIVIDPSHL